MAVQKEQIVGTALDLLGRVGADGLTMRALAGELRIQAPTLYWHFKGKQELFDAMADAMMARVDWGFEAAGDWAAMLDRFARRMRAALLRYRDGARVFAGTYPVTENMFEVADTIFGAMLAAGFSHRDSAWALFTVNYYVIGFVLEEQAIMNGGEAGGAKVSALNREIAAHAADHPDAVPALLELLGENVDERFDFGLEVVLAGLRARRPAVAQ